MTHTALVMLAGVGVLMAVTGLMCVFDSRPIRGLIMEEVQMDEIMAKRPPYVRNNKLPDRYTYRDLLAVVPPNGAWVMAGHNTLARWVEDHVEIRLHEMVVAELHEHHMVLYTNGWVTATTMDRLNRCTEQYGFRCDLQRDGDPLLTKWTPHNGYDHGLAWYLKDGTIVSENGTVNGAEPVILGR